METQISRHIVQDLFEDVVRKNIETRDCTTRLDRGVKHGEYREGEDTHRIRDLTSTQDLYGALSLIKVQPLEQLESSFFNPASGLMSST